MIKSACAGSPDSLSFVMQRTEAKMQEVENAEKKKY